MNTVEIKPDIYWVGAIDWAVRDFHGYVTPQGTTYNNYLVLDDQVTLIDTVHHGFADTTIANIKSVTNPLNIKNIVVNHIENDHAGALGKVSDHAPNAINMYITDRGRKGLEKFYDLSRWKINIVKTGDELKIGKYTLKFIETPMIHWPDSMMTYVKEAKLLISQDAFGQHLATSQRFDDEFVECASHAELEDAAIDYYANILMPFAKLIKSKVNEINKMGLDIDMIAPDHGIIWRREPQRVIDMYNNMSDGKTNLRIVIIYDTMWYGTEQMTSPIIHGIRDVGVDCKVIKLRATPMSVAIKEFWKSRGSLIGSPTLNNEVYPTVAEFMVHLRGLRPKDRMMGAFGSFGWGGGAVNWLYKTFGEIKLQAVEPGLQVNYRAIGEDEGKCYEFGRKFARNVIEYHKNFGNGRI